MRLSRAFSLVRLSSAHVYWLSPTGEVVSSRDAPVHAWIIVKQPEAFGLSREDVKDYSAKGSQVIPGLAGIWNSLIKDGWIAIRIGVGFTARGILTKSSLERIQGHLISSNFRRSQFTILENSSKYLQNAPAVVIPLAEFKTLDFRGGFLALQKKYPEGFADH